MNVSFVLATCLPVFLTLALGMLCRSKQILSREQIDGLKKVVLNITLPAVLVNAFATAEYSTATLAIPVVVYVLCYLALLLGMLYCKIFRLKGHATPFLSTGFEAGMIGYALFALLFPLEAESRFAILDLGHVLFVFTLFKILITGKTDGKAILKDMVSSPILWAVIVGFILGVTGLYGKLHDWGVGGILDALTAFVSAPTGMVILLTIGYDLVLREIPWKKTAGLVAMRLVVMGALATVLLLLNRYLLDGIMLPGAVLLMCILPPPFVIPVFVDAEEERVQISAALSAMTLMTMILFAVLTVVYG
ncbi:MAG: hypothetical protein J6K84_00950 [Oscillospiraceae bacterium]|nr:hypothetical protein [Oscillospiraceae bacterium]